MTQYEFLNAVAEVVEKCAINPDDTKVDFDRVMIQADRIHELGQYAINTEAFKTMIDSDAYLDMINTIRDKNPDARSRVTSAVNQMIRKINITIDPSEILGVAIVSMHPIDHFIKLYKKENP